jgi:hypothetical protein
LRLSNPISTHPDSADGCGSEDFQRPIGGILRFQCLPFSQKVLDSAFKAAVKNMVLVLAGGLVAIAGVVVGGALSGGDKGSHQA